MLRRASPPTIRIRSAKAPVDTWMTRLRFATQRSFPVIVVSEPSADSPADRFFGSFARVEEG